MLYPIKIVLFKFTLCHTCILYITDEKAHQVIFQNFGNLLDETLLDGTELPVVYLWYHVRTPPHTLFNP